MTLVHSSSNTQEQLLQPHHAHSPGHDWDSVASKGPASRRPGGHLVGIGLVAERAANTFVVVSLNPGEAAARDGSIRSLPLPLSPSPSLSLAP